jgi:hypothetical protein
MKRRDFLKSTGLVAGASVLGGMSVARGANVGGDDVIKIALVGCGGRGRGAVADRFSAKDNVKLVAIADAFEANAKSAAEAFQNMDPDRVDLGDRVFWGFDAYKKAIDECDQALIVTSPGFRPIHYKYAIEQGKHVFMEKPCCVDARGYKMAMETNKLADEKGLTVVVGFQRHYEPQYMQMVEQIKEGKIGEIMYSRVYWNGDGIWERGRQEGDTEMMYQMRNWYHFNWLCGDGIVLSALKAAEDGQGLILRAWESRGERVPACIKLSFADIEIRREFGPYEVCTFRIDGDTVTETDFVEIKF